MRACSGLGAGGSADRVHVRAEELEEVGDGHVDRDGENAELGRALLREHIVVLEDAHLSSAPKVLSQRLGPVKSKQRVTNWTARAHTCPLNF